MENRLGWTKAREKNKGQTPKMMSWKLTIKRRTKREEKNEQKFAKGGGIFESRR